MTDNTSPANRNQDESDRQRRLAALQQLAQRDLALEPVSPKALEEHTLPALAERGRPRGRRRWIIPLVAGALLVALAVVAIFQFAPGLRDGASTARTSALIAQVISLPASAKLYCPSMPAWSPDGKYIAVMARTVEPGGEGACYPYGDLVNNTTRQDLINGYTGPFTWAMTALVLDAKTGALVRRLNPADPTSVLCKDAIDCEGGPIEPVSLSWSPDGANVLMFTSLNVQYQGPSGQTFGQTRGALDIMRADGTNTSRALMAYGRATLVTDNIQSVNLYSSPLFVWDLTTSTASSTDIHEAAGVETAPYAPAFLVGPSGNLTAMSAPAVGGITPWSYGALSVDGGVNGPYPNVLFRSSQWAWSADGRYVVPNVDTTAYMNVAKVTSNALPGFQGTYTPPFVVPPDAATVAVVREMTPRKAATYVARDRHGARLASYTCAADGDTGKLTIRATASGATLATTIYQFPTLSTSFGCPGDAEAIDWSPDGSRIAMTDIQDNQIVLWQVPAGA